MENKEDIGWEENWHLGKVTSDMEMQCNVDGEREEGEIIETEPELKQSELRKVEVVEAIKNLERRMELVELSLSTAQGGKSAWKKAQIITSVEMESMVKKAVSLGPSYGVGRGFIKTHLNREMGVPDSQHYAKRMGQAIRNLVARNEMALDEQFQLYKNV